MKWVNSHTVVDNVYFTSFLSVRFNLKRIALDCLTLPKQMLSWILNISS